MTRRDFLRWTGVAASALAVPVLTGCPKTVSGTGPDPQPPPDRAVVTVGCYSQSYNGYGASAMGCGLVNTFGDPGLDGRFVQEVAIQNQFWQGMSAEVYAFDECADQKNALSFPEGFILFGKNLSRSVIMETGTDLPLAGVMAHEWGHQMQFRLGWTNPNAPTVRDTELEADAFSGFYMGLAKGWAGAQMESYFKTLFGMGDADFNDRNHHGTPNQRVAAGAVGMQVAFDAIRNGVGLTYYDLHAIFTQAISQIVLRRSNISTPSMSILARNAFGRLDKPFTEGVLADWPSVAALKAPPSSENNRKRLFPNVTLEPRP